MERHQWTAFCYIAKQKIDNMSPDRKEELYVTDEEQTVLTLPPYLEAVSNLSHDQVLLILSNCPLSSVYWKSEAELALISESEAMHLVTEASHTWARIETVPFRGPKDIFDIGKGAYDHFIVERAAQFLLRHYLHTKGYLTNSNKRSQASD